MEKKLNYIMITCGLALLLLLGACSEEEVMQPASREIVCIAAMPGDDTSLPQPGTLRSVTVSSNDDVLNLVAKWKEGDKIQIYVRQEGKVYKVDKPCTIYDISSNGKTCSFMFQLPSGIDAEKDYDVIGVTGVENTSISGSDVIAVSQMKRIALESNGEAPSPMWFVTTKSASSASVQVQFQHLGTYEVLHVKNKSKSSITFRHCGFEVSRKWYKTSDNTVLSTNYNPSSSSASGEVESDKSITILAGGSGRVLSWYIPSGTKVENAKLKATVGGSSVMTTDTKSSSVTIERGKAYHMTVTWDGKDLRFNERDSCPDNNHPHAIDLGLPSGTKWACCNIGATTPEGYGNYYAWGETAPKSLYDWSTYKWCNGGVAYLYVDLSIKLTKYCTNNNYGTVDNKTELDPADDAAYVNWGSGWRMPSLTQIQELIDNCTTESTTRNGVYGRLFTSNINSASLFLPAAGYRLSDVLDFAGISGSCWSRTLFASSPNLADYLYFGSGDVSWYYRYYGRSVRAVRVSQN